MKIRVKPPVGHGQCGQSLFFVLEGKETNKICGRIMWKNYIEEEGQIYDSILWISERGIVLSLYSNFQLSRCKDGEKRGNRRMDRRTEKRIQSGFVKRNGKKSETERKEKL
jgi:hypothetical protein